MTRTVAPSLEALPGGRVRLLVPTLFLINFVTAAISSLGAPLIDLISVDYHISVSDAQWALISCLMVGAIASPVMGRLGDGSHRRATIIGGLVAVTAGAALSASTSLFALLLIGRALQGVGLGIVPLTMALARDSLPTARAHSVIAGLSVTGATGVGIGYPLSGLIGEHLGVQAAYWTGAAFAGLMLIAAVLVVPASTSRTVKSKLDIPGACILSAALFVLLLATARGSVWGWSSAITLGLLSAGVVLVIVWVPTQLRSQHPLVDLRLLKIRAVAGANSTAVLLAMAMYIYLSVVPTFIQVSRSTGYGLGESAVSAGFVLVPLSIATLVSSGLASALRRFVSRRVLLSAGCGVTAISGAYYALEHHNIWQTYLMMTLLGLGLGLTFALIPGLIVRAVPEDQTGSAMGFYQVLRFVGFSIGTALASSQIAAHFQRGTNTPAAAGYINALWLAVALSVAAGVIAAVVSGRVAKPAPKQVMIESDNLATRADPLAN